MAEYSLNWIIAESNFLLQKRVIEVVQAGSDIEENVITRLVDLAKFLGVKIMIPVCPLQITSF